MTLMEMSAQVTTGARRCGMVSRTGIKGRAVSQRGADVKNARSAGPGYEPRRLGHLLDLHTDRLRLAVAEDLQLGDGSWLEARDQSRETVAVVDRPPPLDGNEDVAGLDPCLRRGPVRIHGCHQRSL